jgi:hypothetical protein
MNWEIGSTIGVNKGNGKATCTGFEGNEAIFLVDDGVTTIRLPYIPQKVVDPSSIRPPRYHKPKTAKPSLEEPIEVAPTEEELQKEMEETEHRLANLRKLQGKV